MLCSSPKSKALDRFVGAGVWVAAGLLILPPFLHPIYNSDLFWHLSTGRNILQRGALPAVAAPALIPPVTAWIDFEWLSQVVYQATYAAAGMRGLWALKAALLAACVVLLLATLRRSGVASEFRAGALALWTAGSLFFADIRPELFSVALFGALLAALEIWRSRDFVFTAGERAAIAGGFALWANLHGGFVCGLIAFACYLAPELARRRWTQVRSLSATAACAAAGTLANPYGWGPHRVILAHWRQGEYLSRYLFEWQPIVLRRGVPLQPIVALALASAAVVLALLLGARSRRARLPWGLILCAAFFGAQAARHMRMAAFFDTPAVLMILIAAREADWLKTKAARIALISALAVDAAFVSYYSPHLSKAFPIDESEIPVAAADFLERERPVVESLRIYAEWNWGGYLAWRLEPWYRILMDGRYIFHERLEPIHAAIAAGPQAWRGLFEDWHLNAALVHRGAGYYPEILLPDGRPWGRPWHELYMPRSNWALVYADPQALFFIRRNAAPSGWISSHEIPRGGLRD
jgi:hypothetical protein